MVSFCDIPLSLAKDHINKYGSYAIGMSKEWGVRNNLNPVVYIENKSLLAKDIQRNLDKMLEMIGQISKNIDKLNEDSKTIPSKVGDFLKNIKSPISDTAFSIVQREFASAYEKLDKSLEHIKDYSTVIERISEATLSNNNLFRYIKNYQGSLARNGKTINNYRFYDEREWRFIPSISDSRIKSSLKAKEYTKYRGQNKIKPFIKNINLSFSSADIKYLIVKSNNDIPNLIKVIKSTDNLVQNSNDADILTTKILTTEQLNNDF
jgi:DNA-binding transcriptional regulator GbsR (MarR family)